MPCLPPSHAPLSIDRLGRSATLEALGQICRRGRLDDRQPTGQSTGFSALDSLLPGAGWPVGAVTELLHTADGIGELGLMMPALAALTGEGQYVAWVDPPHLPYPPALAQHGIALDKILFIRSGPGPSQTSTHHRAANRRAIDTLWAAEQLLRCPAFGAVLAWPQQPSDKNLRRLQLAAEAGRNLAILYRPAEAASSASPAALRLILRQERRGLSVTIHKCRGQRAGMTVHCPLGHGTSVHALE